MLVKKGRVELQTTAADFVNLFLQSRNVSVVQITPDVADLSVNLGPEINSDPADRIIAATSIIHNARLVTADKNLIGSGLLETLW